MFLGSNWLKSHWVKRVILTWAFLLAMATLFWQFKTYGTNFTQQGPFLPSSLISIVFFYDYLTQVIEDYLKGYVKLATTIVGSLLAIQAGMLFYLAAS